MRFYHYLLLSLSLGCTTPLKGTEDTARPLRPNYDEDGGSDADDGSDAGSPQLYTTLWWIVAFSDWSSKRRHFSVVSCTQL